MSTRETGIIERAECGPEPDRGIQTVHILFEFDGSIQAMCPCFKTAEQAQSFARDICAAFGIDTLDKLVGRPAVALRSFPYWGEPIEGIESPTGQRVTLTGWRRRNGQDVSSPLELKRGRMWDSIERFARSISETTRDLKRIDRDFVDWEKP